MEAVNIIPDSFLVDSSGVIAQYAFTALERVWPYLIILIGISVVRIVVGKFLGI